MEGESDGQGPDTDQAEILQLRHEKKELQQRQNALEEQWEETSETNQRLQTEVDRLQRKVREQSQLLERRKELAVMAEDLDAANAAAQQEIRDLRTQLSESKAEVDRLRKVTRGQDKLNTFLNSEYFRSESRNSMSSTGHRLSASRPLSRKTIGGTGDRMRLGSLDQSLRKIKSRLNKEMTKDKEKKYRGPPASLLAMADDINGSLEQETSDGKQELVDDLNKELQTLRDALDEERERAQQMHLDLERLRRLRDMADGKGVKVEGLDMGDSTTESNVKFSLADELAGSSSTDPVAANDDEFAAAQELASIEEGSEEVSLELRVEALELENAALLERLADEAPLPGTEESNELVDLLRRENLELKETSTVLDKQLSDLRVGLAEAKSKQRRAMEDALAARAELYQLRGLSSPMLGRRRMDDPEDPTQMDDMNLPSAIEQRNIQLQLKQLDLDDDPLEQLRENQQRLRVPSAQARQPRNQAGLDRRQRANTAMPSTQRGQQRPRTMTSAGATRPSARRSNDARSAGLLRSRSVAARPAKPMSITSWFNNVWSGNASKPNTAAGVGMLPSAKHA